MAIVLWELKKAACITLTKDTLEDSQNERLEHASQAGLMTPARCPSSVVGVQTPPSLACVRGDLGCVGIETNFLFTEP